MEEKKCTKCLEVKILDNYVFKNKAKGTLKSTCKQCDRELRQQYYIDNKSRIIDKVTENNKTIKLRNQQFVWDYYKNNPCIDCGETNPIVLEFDHRDGTEKLDNIADIVDRSWSTKRLQEEISKCDVRCANCHRIRTAKQQNWYKNIDL